jgi:hypothetical protein
MIYRYIIDDGASSCIFYSSSWKQLGSPILVPSMFESRVFDGIFYPPLGILPHLHIDLGDKTILINVAIMTGIAPTLLD